VEDRYACFEAGMDGFLIKPLDREKLREALTGLAASRHIAA
jgi:CheY-like chemotaxis protein